MPLSEKSTGIRLSANCLPYTAFAADKSEPSPDVILTLLLSLMNLKEISGWERASLSTVAAMKLPSDISFLRNLSRAGGVVEKLLYHYSSADGTAAGFVLLFLAAFDNVTSAEFIAVLP